MYNRHYVKILCLVTILMTMQIMMCGAFLGEVLCPKHCYNCQKLAYNRCKSPPEGTKDGYYYKHPNIVDCYCCKYGVINWIKYAVHTGYNSV